MNFFRLEIFRSFILLLIIYDKEYINIFLFLFFFFGKTEIFQNTSETNVENKSVSFSRMRGKESLRTFFSIFTTIFCNFFLLTDKILRKMQFEKLWPE